MKMKDYLVLLLVFTCFVFLSCSNSSKGKNVIDDNPLTLPSSEEETKGYSDWGDFTVQLDIENEKAELMVNRDPDAHLDVSPYLSGGALQVRFVSWDFATYELQLEFELNNPTNLNVSDVRLIFTDFENGVYPQRMLNEDSWTDAMTGNVRPFLAFKKGVNNRVFAGRDSETLTARIYWPPGSPFRLNFKVSAWLWINCGDVYEINNMGQSGHLFQYSGSTTVSCYPRDWQNDISNVRLHSSLLTGGIHDMTKVGTYWEHEITNILERPPGNYQVLIEAISPNPQGFTTWNDMLVRVDNYGWHTTPAYYHGAHFGFEDIGCYDYDGYDRVNIIRAKGDMSGWVSKSQGVDSAAQNLVNLENLDPNYPAFQPWPAVRIDAAHDGAFVWNNGDYEIWYSFYHNFNTLSFMRSSLVFAYEPLNDDNRGLWYKAGTQIGLYPYDVCDTFAGRLGSLLGHSGTTNSAMVAIFDGPASGRYSYFDSDLNANNSFRSTMFGTGDGQIDLTYDLDIDIMETNVSGEYLAFISQGSDDKIDVFKVVKGATYVEYVDTIHISYTGDPSPLDIELLPASPDYTPYPNRDILVVLINRQEVNGMSGGIILMYDANTRVYLGSVGNATTPACPFLPKYMDTDDDSYSIVISQENNNQLVLTQWTYYTAP